jgi:hypothetical protein
MSRLVVCALLILAGCKSSPAPAASPQLDHPDRARNPVQLSWQEVRRGATEVELIARVQRLAPLPFPLEVTLALPAGVTVKEGRARFTLPANTEGATHEEKLTLAYATIPEADVELAADGQAIDLGVHARRAYRFGRPEPLSNVVAPKGPDLKQGEKNFGPSIPIEAQAP